VALLTAMLGGCSSEQKAELKRFAATQGTQLVIAMQTWEAVHRDVTRDGVIDDSEQARLQAARNEVERVIGAVLLRIEELMD
jgi:hypothetical protein